MRTVFFAIAVAVATLAAITPAAAQGWGMTTGGGGLGNVPTMSLPGGDWERCTNAERRYSLETAVESCNRMLAERSGRLMDGAIYWQRAMRYLDAGQTTQSEDDLKLAANEFAAWTEANPREYVGYNNHGAVLARLRQYDEALADYDHAAATDSDADSPHIGRGNILFRRGDYAGASAAFDRAARIAARTAATGSYHHSVRCVVRAAAQVDLERGRAFCDRGVRNSDNASYPRTARGFFLFMQGDLDAAAADFARAVEEDEYNAPALYGRGVVAVRQGRTAEGEADMARAMSMDAFEVEYYANAGLRP